MRFDFSLIPTLTLFAMMLAMGMTLRLEDFRRVGSQPGPIALGLLGQLVALPLVAFGIAAALALPQAYAIGLVLIAACPGGITSNALAHYARGDAALSISLTALSSSIAFATVPLIVGFGVAAFGGSGGPIVLPAGEMAVTLFATTALPVFLGMAVRRWRSGLADRVQRPLLAWATGVLMLLVAGLGVSLWRSEEDVAGLFGRTLPAVVLLVGSMTGLGIAGARAAGFEARQGRTIAVELGIQNVNLALVVALSVLEQPRLVGPALVYLPVMFVFAFGLIAAVRSRGNAGLDRRPPSLIRDYVLDTGQRIRHLSSWWNDPS